MELTLLLVKKEVRAWTFKRGIKAPQAAGIIHSDFEKGFIRAVTMSYDDLIKYGSEKAVKEAGRLREEGKEYCCSRWRHHGIPFQRLENKK